MVACSSSAIERAQASAAVRAVSSTSASAWTRTKLASASEGDRDKPGSEGRLQVVPDLCEASKVGGRAARPT